MYITANNTDSIVTTTHLKNKSTTGDVCHCGHGKSTVKATFTVSALKGKYHPDGNFNSIQ